MVPVSSYWANVSLCLGFYVHVSGSVLFKGCCCVVIDNRDLSRIAFAPLIPNSCNSKLSVEIWSLTSSVWAVSKHHLSCLPWLAVRARSGARGTSRLLQVSLRSLKLPGSWWFQLQPTFLCPGWGTGNRPWNFGCVSQGNPHKPLLLSYLLDHSYTMSDGRLLLVAACGKSSKVARQLIEMEEAQAARSGFWARNANEKENDKYLQSWFHLLMLYTQGTFSSWYKVLRQVGETNIWQPHLAKIKYTEIHFTYRCFVFKLNTTTLLWPNLFILVGLGSEANPNMAKDMGPNQAGPQICFNCGAVFCFHKSPF